MNTTIRSKIPTTYFPDDWREKGAEKFNCSANQIERVVYGLAAVNKKNTEIFDFMLSMAESGKKLAEQKELDINNRLKALQD